MVVRTTRLVVDLSRANVSAPATLKQLIARLGRDDAARLAKLAAVARRSRRRRSRSKQVKTLPPIPDPSALLNAAVNYRSTASR